ncbi:MAG TPA: hypothetical protein VH442_11370, partial [Micromonosporaceae bacterium]
MTDRYASFAASSAGRLVVKRLGLPDPPRLRRYHQGARDLAGAVLLGGEGRLVEAVTAVLARLDADVRRPVVTAPGADEKTVPASTRTSSAAPVRGGTAAAKPAAGGPGAAPPAAVGVAVVTTEPPTGRTGGPTPEPSPGPAPEPALSGRFGALIFDATSIDTPERLVALHAFFQPYARSLVPCGRVIVLGTPPELATTEAEAIAQRAIEGFTRSVGKEFGHGTTAQLIYVAPGAELRVESTLRFLLSGKSAYVSGQVIRVGAAGKPATDARMWDWERPLI